MKVTFYSVLVIVIIFIFWAIDDDSVVSNTSFKKVRPDVAEIGSDSGAEVSSFKLTREQDNQDVSVLGKTGKTGGSLESKQQFETDSAHNIRKQALEHRQNLDSSDDYKLQDATDRIKEMFEHIENEDWSLFLEGDDILGAQDQASLDFLLLQAIINNAPFKVIRELINRGADILKETILFLALQNKLELTKKLIPLGLDIHAVNGLGENAVVSTLRVFQSKEMFDFLLNNNVSVKPHTQGLDPLDLALKRLINNEDAFYYVAQLVKYGAPIETSHLELLQRIKIEQPDLYFQMQRTLPELFHSDIED